MRETISAGHWELLLINFNLIQLIDVVNLLKFGLHTKLYFNKVMLKTLCGGQFLYLPICIPQLEFQEGKTAYKYSRTEWKGLGGENVQGESSQSRLGSHR